MLVVQGGSHCEGAKQRLRLGANVELMQSFLPLFSEEARRTSFRFCFLRSRTDSRILGIGLATGGAAERKRARRHSKLRSPSLASHQTSARCRRISALRSTRNGATRSPTRMTIPPASLSTARSVTAAPFAMLPRPIQSRLSCVTARPVRYALSAPTEGRLLMSLRRSFTARRCSGL